MSSQQQQTSMTGSRNVCVITNADSLLGYCLAFRFLEAMQSKEDADTDFHKKLRILCRDREGLGLKRLEEMGAEIMQVDYKDENKMNQALKDVRSVCLIPENSRERLKEAECLMKCAKHQEVEHLCLMSIVGVNRIKQEETTHHEFRNFMEYCQIEKMVQEMFKGKKGSIVRHQIFDQLFYFMAPKIESENVLCLPVNKESKWGCVNLNDVVEGVYRLAKKQHEHDRGREVDQFFHKQIYDFTMHRTMNGEEMAQQVGQGLGLEKIQYKRISEEEFKKYLEHMREDKRFKERPDTGNKFGQGRDGWWSIPIGKFLNEENIETTMEYLRLACKGHLDHSSEDLRKILERNPQDLKEYFKVNRDMFKRFK